jgi:hypothetical protein
MRKIIHILVAALLGTALAAGPGLIAPASAATGDLACIVNFQFNFVPALTTTSTAAQAKATAGFVDCVSPNSRYSNLRSATVLASGRATALAGVPCSLLLTITGTGTITWSPTGQKSGFTFTVNTDPFNGTVSLSAVVTSGPLAGDTLSAVPAEANPNSDCAVNGLRTLTSTDALVLAG